MYFDLDVLPLPKFMITILSKYFFPFCRKGKGAQTTPWSALDPYLYPGKGTPRRNFFPASHTNRSAQMRLLVLLGYSFQASSCTIQIVFDTHDLQQHSGRALPLLLDMDLHYRILKLIYSTSYVEFDLPRRLNRVPLIYGICSQELLLLKWEFCIVCQSRRIFKWDSFWQFLLC